jgi:hypothetical protein
MHRSVRPVLIVSVGWWELARHVAARSVVFRLAGGRSYWLGYRVAGEEARESVGHGGGVLGVQEVGETGQVEWLGAGQPVQQQLLPFGEQRGAGGPPDGEYWLLDAVRVVFGERPLPEGG